MTEVNPDQITGNIAIPTERFAIAVQPQDNGQYICQLSSSLSDSPKDNIQCYGQTKEHAIAIALEQLAEWT